MIEYLKGEIAELTPATAVIDCNGVGYAASISLNTYSAIQGKKACKLYIYEAIREDAYTLFGFADRQERELFLLLISVSGIGGNTARMILSALSPNELINVISNENANLLKSVKGIGLKTAQRIIVDLKDKIKTGAVAAASTGGTAQDQDRGRGRGQHRRNRHPPRQQRSDGRGGGRPHDAGLRARPFAKGGDRHPEGRALRPGGTGHQTGPEKAVRMVRVR